MKVYSVSQGHLTETVTHSTTTCKKYVLIFLKKKKTGVTSSYYYYKEIKRCFTREYYNDSFKYKR